MNSLVTIYNLCVKIQNDIVKNFKVSEENLQVSNETLKLVKQIKPNDSSNANNDLHANATILTDVANIKAILANSHHLSNTAMFENSMFNKTIEMTLEEKIAFTKTPVFDKMQQDHYNLLKFHYDDYVINGGNTNNPEMLVAKARMITANHDYNVMNHCLKTKHLSNIAKNVADEVVDEMATLM
jgi:hypothetical protein